MEAKEKLLYHFQDLEGFLVQMYSGKWNHVQFIELIQLAIKYCQEIEGKTQLSREIAEGFYTLDIQSRDLIHKYPFTTQFSGEYYSRCLELIGFIVGWFFSDQSPFDKIESFEKELDAINVLSKENKE